jgi:hypothetical protein
MGRRWNSFSSTLERAFEQWSTNMAGQELPVTTGNQTEVQETHAENYSQANTREGGMREL